MRPQILVVSHGPHCLDGVTAAAAVARYFEPSADVAATFASNSEIDRTLRALRPAKGRGSNACDRVLQPVGCASQHRHGILIADQAQHCAHVPLDLFRRRCR